MEHWKPWYEVPTEEFSILEFLRTSKHLYFSLKLFKASNIFGDS